MFFVTRPLVFLSFFENGLAISEQEAGDNFPEELPMRE